MRSFLTYFLAIVAILTGVLGIFNFTIQYQLVNADVYTQALEESGIYSTTTNIVTESVSTGLVGLQKTLIDQLVASNIDTQENFTNRIVLTLINTLIDSQTPRLVESLMQRIKFEENVVDYTTQAVVTTTAWFRGDIEAGDLFDRIPTPEQVVAFRQASLSQLLYQLTSNRIGTRELPFCTTSADVQTNLQRALSGEFEAISCTNNQIQPLLDVFFSSNIANQAIDSAEADIQTRMEASGMTKIIDGVYEAVLTVTELKQMALELRTYLELNLRISYALLATSLITLVLAAILRTQRRLKLIITSLFAVGVIVLGVSVLYYGLLSEVVLYQLGITQLTSFAPYLSNSQNLALLDSLNRLVGYVLQHLLDFSIYVGVGLTVISGTLWIMHDLITSSKVQATVLSAGRKIGRGIRNASANAQKKINSWTKKPDTGTKTITKANEETQKDTKKKTNKKK